MAVAAISASGSRTPVSRSNSRGTLGDPAIDGDLTKGPQDDVHRVARHRDGEEFGTGDDREVNPVVAWVELAGKRHLPVVVAVRASQDPADPIRESRATRLSVGVFVVAHRGPRHCGRRGPEGSRHRAAGGLRATGVPDAANYAIIICKEGRTGGGDQGGRPCA
jgi:hypothetical protein